VRGTRLAPRIGVCSSKVRTAEKALKRFVDPGTASASRAALHTNAQNVLLFFPPQDVSKLKTLFAGSAITARPFVRYIQAVDGLEAEADCAEN